MNKTKKITTLAMLCAAAFIMVFFVRIPIMPAVPFLKYEPKDVIIVIGGFIYGPMASLIVSVVVSLIELVTISETGFIGLAMNIISSCSFACVAAGIYKAKRTMGGAIAGLICGIFAMSCLMLLWNYLITPLYMNIEREVLASMLIPAFLPFNLIKGIMNAALSLILYKPVITALRKTGSVAPGENSGNTKIAIIAEVLFLIISFISLYIVMR